MPNDEMPNKIQPSSSKVNINKEIELKKKSHKKLKGMKIGKEWCVPVLVEYGY